jgi:nucleotide-binding universal stress UspA family protein
LSERFGIPFASAKVIMASPPNPPNRTNRLLVLTDFSDCARPALDFAVTLARWMGASLHLLYVSEVPGVLIGDAVADGDQFEDADVRSGRGQLDRLLGELRERDVRATAAVRAGFALEVVVDEAAPGAYDMVVMGTNGRSGFRLLCTGSLAESVVRSCRIPVVIVRSQPTD